MIILFCLSTLDHYERLHVNNILLTSGGKGVIYE